MLMYSIMLRTELHITLLTSLNFTQAKYRENYKLKMCLLIPDSSYKLSTQYSQTIEETYKTSHNF